MQFWLNSADFARMQACRVGGLRYGMVIAPSMESTISVSSAVPDGAHVCSVGGLDYGTVRAGAFMGLRMLSGLAEQLQRQSSYTSPSKPRACAPANGLACSPIGKHSSVLDLCSVHGGGCQRQSLH